MARPKKPKKQDDKPAVETFDARALDAEKTGEEIENWADRPDSDAYVEAAKLYPKIAKCYENKQEQMDRCEEYWSIYNAQPDENQQYSGNSQCYIPAVRNAVNARVKRTLAQLFPVNHKHVGATGPDGNIPFAQISLLEHYIRSAAIKDVVRADLIAGDVTGQWNLYVDWSRTQRRITELIKKPPILEDHELGGEIEDLAADDDEWDWEKETKEVTTEGPDIVPFATEDLAVYPPTCNDIEKATATAIRLRLTIDAVQQFVDEGIFVGVSAKELVDNLAKPDGGREKYVPPKRRTGDAGIRTEGTFKYALIYEVHTNLDLGNGKEPCFVYFAGQDVILGIIRNPYWSGKRPIISAPIERITGSFFGISKIEPVKFLQWNLNDFWNMGQDSAQYSLLPITMVDPLSSPNYQSMVVGLAAVWLTDPNKTKFANFPAIYKDAIPLCENLKQQINESMDVNDAMLGKMPAGRKNQAQMAAMAQQQESNIIDNAKRYEEVILNPLVEWMFELDRQFRTEELTVEVLGELGARANLQTIPPQAFGERYFFRWCGTSYQQNLQRMQQMIAWMNVLRGIPPQQLDGRRLNIGPILEYGTEQIFGPEVAPRILIDERNLFHLDPQDENLMMHNGLPAEIHQADDDRAHIAAHLQAAQLTGDPQGLFRAHIQQHQQAMQAKLQAQQAPNPPQGQPGVPGGAGPGVAGTPRPGAQPGQPRPQGPAGMIHPDQLSSPMVQPR
ncbi:portal protein [Burkholderia cenocepacia]